MGFFQDLIWWRSQQEDDPSLPQAVKDKQLPTPAFDPVQHHAKTARILAFVVVGALIVVLALDFLTIVFNVGDPARVTVFFRIAEPILAGLSGAAFGYYLPGRR